MTTVSGTRQQIVNTHCLRARCNFTAKCRFMPCRGTEAEFAPALAVGMAFIVILLDCSPIIERAAPLKHAGNDAIPRKQLPAPNRFHPKPVTTPKFFAARDKAVAGVVIRLDLFPVVGSTGHMAIILEQAFDVVANMLPRVGKCCEICSVARRV